MNHAFGQSHHLNAEYFVARGLHVGGPGDERQGLDGPLQHEIPGLCGLSLDGCHLLVAHAPLGIGKGGIVASLAAQPLHIDLCRLHLALQGEAFALGQQPTVLVDEGIATVDHVLRALAETRAAVHIGRNRARALLCQ